VFVRLPTLLGEVLSSKGEPASPTSDDNDQGPGLLDAASAALASDPQPHSHLDLASTSVFPWGKASGFPRDHPTSTASFTNSTQSSVSGRHPLAPALTERIVICEIGRKLY
jgi:hypothetical protein